MDGSCLICGGAIVEWEAYMDVGICPLGHRVTANALYSNKLTHTHANITNITDPGHSHGRDTWRHMQDTYSSSIEALIAARDAQLLTPAEARLVALEMFPAAKRLADAKKLVDAIEATG